MKDTKTCLILLPPPLIGVTTSSYQIIHDLSRWYLSVSHSNGQHTLHIRHTQDVLGGKNLFIQHNLQMSVYSGGWWMWEEHSLRKVWDAEEKLLLLQFLSTPENAALVNPALIKPNSSPWGTKITIHFQLMARHEYKCYPPQHVQPWQNKTILIL